MVCSNQHNRTQQASKRCTTFPAVSLCCWSGHSVPWLNSPCMCSYELPHSLHTVLDGCCPGLERSHTCPSQCVISYTLGQQRLVEGWPLRRSCYNVMTHLAAHPTTRKSFHTVQHTVQHTTIILCHQQPSWPPCSTTLWGPCHCATLCSTMHEDLMVATRCHVQTPLRFSFVQ
jgi:hypothetical protein